MKIRELNIPGAWEFTPTLHGDDRGMFFESYRHDALEEVSGRPLVVRQANTSVSSRGVLRGIHYALVPPGQAKYVTAPRGAFIDFVIDLRVGSPTFGEWDSVTLDDVERRAVYLSEGLGHALLSLAEQSTVSYLVSEVFNASRELTIDAFDPAIGLVVPTDAGTIRRSDRDSAAPSLAVALASGWLPTWDDCRSLTTTSADPGTI